MYSDIVLFFHSLTQFSREGREESKKDNNIASKVKFFLYKIVYKKSNEW